MQCVKSIDLRKEDGAGIALLLNIINFDINDLLNH